MYIFSFHSSLGLLIFTFDMHFTYLFCMIKNNRNNIRCTAEGKKIKQMLSKESYHICSFKWSNPRISPWQLSVSYILRGNSLSEGKIVDNKDLMKLWTNQSFCNIVLFKTLNNFANVICICIFRKAKSASFVEIKQKK